MRHLLFSLLLLLTLPGAVLAQTGTITISDAWARASAGSTSVDGPTQRGVTSSRAAATI